MEEFSVSRTIAILTISLYVLALGLGPVIGGPASEIVGRRPVYLSSLLLGGLFTLGAGLTHNFSGLCILRLLSGMSWGPILAVAPASIAETYPVSAQALPMSLLILTPFLGPGLGYGIYDFERIRHADTLLGRSLEPI
jgi:MFS family permease